MRLPPWSSLVGPWVTSRLPSYDAFHKSYSGATSTHDMNGKHEPSSCSISVFLSSALSQHCHRLPRTTRIDHNKMRTHRTISKIQVPCHEQWFPVPLSFHYLLLTRHQHLSPGAHKASSSPLDNISQPDFSNSNPTLQSIPLPASKSHQAIISQSRLIDSSNQKHHHHNKQKSHPQHACHDASPTSSPRARAVS